MNRKLKHEMNHHQQKRLLRLELWFAPFLIMVPLAVSLVLVGDWYLRGFSVGSSLYDGEFILGLMILIGNMFFDIPFLLSLKSFKKIIRRDFS